jgi:lipopolysaccharide export LptBFGC system permease protein LptF
MWRLHRYYLRELAVNASVTFLVLFAIALVSFIYRGIQRAAGGTLTDALVITVLFALDSMQHLLTIAFLLATVMTYTRAAQDRELVAIRAAGISPRVPMTAALLLGTFLSFGASLAMHYVIPWVHYHKYHVVADVMRNVILNLRLGTDRIKLLDTGFVMTYREQDAGAYRDCRIYCPRQLQGMESPILFVDKVTIPEFQEDDVMISIVLTGVRDPIGGGHNREDIVFSVPADDIGNRNRRADGDADLRSDQLLAEVLRDVHPEPHAAWMTLFRRCCASLMPAVLGPIGYALGELSRERGRVFALLLTLVPLVLFYVGDMLGVHATVATRNPVFGWLPMILLGLFGVPVLRRALRR